MGGNAFAGQIFASEYFQAGMKHDFLKMTLRWGQMGADGVPGTWTLTMVHHTSVIMDDVQVPFADFRLVRGPIVPQTNEFGLRGDETAPRKWPKIRAPKLRFFFRCIFYAFVSILLKCVTF